MSDGHDVYEAAREEYRKKIRELAEENERLRAEVQTWKGHAKTAVWSDSEECKLLTADNERLRAALEWIVGTALTGPQAMVDKARAALGEENSND